MKIKMKKTTLGSSNGINVQSYNEGEIYEVVESLGNALVQDKVAVVILPDQEVFEAKKQEIIEENKMASFVEENKVIEIQGIEEVKAIEDEPKKRGRKKIK